MQESIQSEGGEMDVLEMGAETANELRSHQHCWRRHLAKAKRDVENTGDLVHKGWGAAFGTAAVTHCLRRLLHHAY